MADMIGPVLRIGSSVYWNRGLPMPADAAGPIVGTVCRRAIQAGEDGDAPFAAGAAIHAIAGYDPRFRVGVVDGEQLQVFELVDDPQASTGADLIDLSSGVDAVELRDLDGGGATLDTWTDERVQALATGLARGPVVRDSPSGEGPRYLVVFRMRDGTTVERGFEILTGRLDRVQLDATTRALFDAAPRPPARLGVGYVVMPRPRRPLSLSASTPGRSGQLRS